MGLFGFGIAKSTPIGHGVSGSVDLREKNHEFYVVKTYHSKEKYETKKEYQERVLHEFRVLDLLHQENFIKVRKYSVLFDGLTVKLYMEAGTSDLASIFKKIDPSRISKNEVLCLWKQLCCGITYLHAQGLCHRDLKLDNLVLDRHSNTLKILDLATACKSGNGEKAAGMVGSKSYMAPETYSQIVYDGQGADVWSVAIILYYFTNRAFPWSSAVWNDERYAAFAGEDGKVGHNEGKVGHNEGNIGHNEGEPVLNEASGVVAHNTLGPGASRVFLRLPLESVKLASQMLAVDPDSRIHMAQLVQDKWFESVASCTGNSSCGEIHVLR